MNDLHRPDGLELADIIRQHGEAFLTQPSQIRSE
jgi:hypothetical protein